MAGPARRRGSPRVAMLRTVSPRSEGDIRHAISMQRALCIRCDVRMRVRRGQLPQQTAFGRFLRSHR
jgi:hypothetical protein